MALSAIAPALLYYTPSMALSAIAPALLYYTPSMALSAIAPALLYYTPSLALWQNLHFHPIWITNRAWGVFGEDFGGRESAVKPPAPKFHSFFTSFYMPE
ncbi:hypothetical protein Q9L42_011275 [Methylomarinum sp. Ch1-1]|uniref:Uncharacterized protein n=1 Tax=Methylomarinum roseum TaxID=3067653 RepID=A0AAU7NPR5_9GAMM|nr:hypothetical protein [Methylomarinum sp. Ch1-1]MDP4521120.1 hypothetical protein [Methylomarinum sp. Ch1-1]